MLPSEKLPLEVDMHLAHVTFSSSAAISWVATRFDEFYREPRERFATMTPKYKFAQAWGDWGAAWAEDVDWLLNDIRIPARLQRRLFLLNLIRGAYGEPECVDFYSVSYPRSGRRI